MKTDAAEQPPFWERKPLEAMSRAEWESLCDGCGRCCLHKLEDEDDGELAFTNVACRYLDASPDSGQCRCAVYQRRQERVADCLVLAPQSPYLKWLPASCAYRRLSEGRPLADWHPLVSGDPASVHRAGIGMRGRTISETDVHPDDLDQFIITWIE